MASSVCLGADSLLQLLKNYCRTNGVKTSITVGIIGYPNVGKSSLINSLKRSRAVGVSSTAGFTRTVQVAEEAAVERRKSRSIGTFRCWTVRASFSTATTSPTCSATASTSTFASLCAPSRPGTRGSRGNRRADDAVAAQEPPVSPGLLPDSRLPRWLRWIPAVSSSARDAGVRGTRAREAETRRNSGSARGGVYRDRRFQQRNDPVLCEAAAAIAGRAVGMRESGDAA